MVNPKKVQTILCIIIVSSIAFATFFYQTADANRNNLSALGEERTGAWVDTVNIQIVASMDDALDQLEAEELHFYSGSSTDPVLYQRIQSNPDLVSYQSIGNYFELMFNPAGLFFSGTGKLNPFNVPEIREAMNWLIDRRYIVQQIYGGLAATKFFCISTSFPDYARYHETVQTLEAYYTYDPARANAVISTEMANLGAIRVNGKWHYNGDPVTLIFIIRVEDERTQVGDYIADQLESIGFAVERQYMTSAEASQLWLQSNPNDGLWHMYTGGWVSTAINRDAGGNFDFFYTPRGYPSPLWQAYTPSPEFNATAEKLANSDFDNMAERDQLFNDALEMSMLDSVHIWLIDQTSFNPRQAETTASYDLAGGFLNSDLWPYTVRFIDQEGGVINIGQQDNLVEPWNPLAGSNWIYDHFAQRATRDKGVVSDTNTGLARPQRIESAEIYAEDGLVLNKTLDWVSLAFSPTIEVPDDAWVDWDATNQVWITAAEKYPQTQTAAIKSVVHYPADLFTTIIWHDGSILSVADFVMAMIMPFDIAKESSPIYDESQVGHLENFLQNFKGYRIISTDPLIIEYYTDAYRLDAELNVYPLWPNYGFGDGAWHNMALGYLADANQALAFSKDKADYLGIEWMDFISGISISTLEGYLDQASTMNYIPYANTLGAYITTGEATTRWANLQAWYIMHGHFWLGTGPFYLDTVSHESGHLRLQRFLDFPDPAGKWDHFSHDASPASLEMNYDTGAPGSAFNVVGTNFPINSVASIHINYQYIGNIFTGEAGTFTFTLTTDSQTDEGYYIVTVSVNPTASTMLQLDAFEPVRPLEGDHESFQIPDDIAITDFIYLPLIER